MVMGCRRIAFLVPLVAVLLQVLRDRYLKAARDAQQFDFASWQWKFIYYASVNPRVLPMKNHSKIVAWATHFTEFEPLNALPFTPTLTCEPRVSRLFDRFDWRLYPDLAHRVDIKTKVDMTCGPLEGLPWVFERLRYDPQTVWAPPHSLPLLLDYAEKSFDTNRADRVVLFSGTEMPLSVAFGRTEAERAATVGKLRKYFSRIVYQTKDIPMEGVHLAPMGLSWGYMMYLIGSLSGWPHPFLAYGEFAANMFVRLKTSGKTREVLAAWGRVAGWLETNRTKQRCREYRAAGKLFPPSNSSLRAVEAAGVSRKQLRAWLSSPAAAAAGAEMLTLKPWNYWEELVKFKFMLAPMGSNIQTAKNLEALLALAVPIVQHMGFSLFPELLELGFPIVLVDTWNEVTPANTTKWWKEMSPRLESFRRNCLTIEGYWSMYIGRVKTCH
mmetsp:Transcript_85442/g.226940  ORF Transcript_85442/g.226940 Transcript_85442/m.226940 type:complete len:441 (-) Transcript_85442:32-1354(-)